MRNWWSHFDGGRTINIAADLRWRQTFHDATGHCHRQGSDGHPFENDVHNFLGRFQKRLSAHSKLYGPIPAAICHIKAKAGCPNAIETCKVL